MFGVENILDRECLSYISDKYAHLDEYKAAKKMLEMAGVKTRQFIPKHKHLIIDFDKINS